MKKIVIARNIGRMLHKINSFLDRSDMRVFTAASNDEALRIHQTVRTDLVITDFNMPGMKSRQLCLRLRGEAEQHTVPIIIVCSKSKSAIERSSRCGAEAVIQRPVKRAQLLSKAQELLKISLRETNRVLLNISIQGNVSNRPFSCRTLDISVTGMLIETDQTFNQGDRLDCSFFLPDLTQIQASGVIARSVLPAPGVNGNWYGVQFSGLSPKAAAALQTCISATSAK